MKYYLIILWSILLLTACGQNAMETPKDARNQFQKFQQKEKFLADPKLLYPGIGDPSLKPILTEKINQAAADFQAVAQSEAPTAKKYQEKIGVGLKRFAAIYINLDTEDRERVASYFEELMDIVDLESSAGQLNEFVYGFDPMGE